MNIYDFLDLQEQQKLYVVRMIEENDALYLTLEQLKKLGLSKFKMQKLIAEINQDLKTYIDPEMMIKFEKQLFLTCPSINENTVSILQMNYLERSYKFLFIQELLYKATPITDFAEKHYISVTKAYSVQKEVIQLLKNYHIKLKNGYLIGSEWTIRNMYFEIYFKGYHGLKYPFQDSAAIEHLYQSLLKLLDVQLSPTQQIKFSLLLSVQYYRLQNNHIIKQKPSLENVDSKLQHKALNILRENFSINKDELINESNYLLIFMVAEDYSMSAKPKLAPSEMKKIHLFLAKTNKLLTSIVGTKQLETTVWQNYLTKLQQEVYRIHIKWLFFPPIANTFATKAQFNYFQEIFPEYYYLVEKHMKQNIISATERSYAMLFYDYLFALITAVPIEALSSQIYICIDFSRGALYSDYISNNILKFEALNIVLQRIPTEQTDLYISDFALTSLECRQLIWKEPPSNTDWNLLGDQLVEIREEHLYERI